MLEGGNVALARLFGELPNKRRLGFLYCAKMVLSTVLFYILKKLAYLV